MLQNLVKHGQQWALVFDQPLLDKLNIDPESPVEMITTENSVTIKSPLPATREAIVQAAREKIHADHAAAFKKLAE
jgi:hypothetical protein